MAQRACLPMGPFILRAGRGELCHVALSPTCPFHKAAHREIRGLERARNFCSDLAPWPDSRSVTSVSRPFARRSGGGSLAWRGWLGVLGDTSAQRLHEIDHPLRRGKGLPALLNSARLPGLQVRQQRLLVAVAKAPGVKLCGLTGEDKLGKLAHVRGNGDLGEIVKIILDLADLIGVAQRH